MDGAMMTYVPKGLRVAAQKLGSFNRNRFRLETVSGETSGPGRTSTFTLPENSVIDLHSFKVHALATTSEVEATPGTPANGDVYGRLPADAMSLVSRLEVYCGGVQVQQSFPELYTAARLLKVARASLGKDRSIDKAMSHGTVLAAADANEVASLVWSSFPGFLSESSVRYLDTSLCGTIQVRITWADDSALVVFQKGVAFCAGAITSTAAAATLTYSLSNLYATIDTVAVDGYQEMLRLRMQSEGGIQINYKEYLSQSLDGIMSTSHTLRWTVDTQSLDRVYITHRDSSYRAKGQDGKTFEDVTLSDGFCSNALFFRSFDANTNAYATEGTAKFQFSLNNVLYPTYQAGAMDSLFSLVHGADKLGDSTDGSLITSIGTFHQGMYVNELVLNMPGEPVALASGYNTKGIQSSLSYTVNGQDLAGSDSISTYMLAETTATLMLGLGRSVAVSH